MNRHIGIPFAAALFGFGLWSLTAYTQPPAGDVKKAQADVFKLIAAMNDKKGNVKDQLAIIKKKFNTLEPIMYAYKPRKKGGIGMKDGSSIETELGKIGNPKSKIRLTNQRVAALKDDLVKSARLGRAIAEISDLYANQYKDNNTGKLNPAKWKEFTEAMRKEAEELEKAAKNEDASAIRKAANNLTASCTECHSVFR